ncbi:MAG: hypothetical protein ABR998_10465 [Gemmatimonadales bacterium]
MDNKGFPAGNPSEDRERLQAWWEEEMSKCGLSGATTVEHSAYQDQSRSSSAGRSLFESLVMQRTAATIAHLYYSKIPGAPWPLEALVTTTSDGVIAEVVYRAVLKCQVRGGVSIKKSIGWFGDKLEIQGVGAEQFKARKDIVRKCKDCLCRRYYYPLRGFHASKEYFELGEASLTLRAEAGTTEAIVRTTVRDEKAFVGRKYSLGLPAIVKTLQMVEQAV